MSNSKWNADAEMAMMGFPIRVENSQHLKHMVAYVLTTLSPVLCRGTSDVSIEAEEIVERGMSKYNSENLKVTWFHVSSAEFGVMLSFVREDEELTCNNGSMKPVLAWVENLTCPYCSELGYIYFEKRRGRVSRVG